MSPPDPAVPEEDDPLGFLTDGVEMGERTRAFDWAATPLGPAIAWPLSLKTAVSIMLGCRYPLLIWWGPDLLHFYNDNYIPVLGKRHPEALGRPAPEVWAEAWPTIGPQAEAVMANGRSYWNEDLPILMTRNGYPEEVYMTFSYGPIRDERGRVGGLFCACTEETQRVLGRRRLRTLRALADRAAQVKTAEAACAVAAATLAHNPHDVPFALFYLLEPDGRQATLAGLTRLDPNTPLSPATIDLNRPDAPWPLRAVAESCQPVEVDGLSGACAPVPEALLPIPPEKAVVLPLLRSGQNRLAGFLVVGVSPLRPLDDDYKGFVDLLAGQTATAVSNARAHEEEKKRAEALAELDLAKTAFFSNVSHEFRTPLTLILGPVGDLLGWGEADLSPAAREELTVIHRNSLRLLKLVNTMLDFSRIEAGRIQASYEPVDLAAYTAELASMFQATIERAGLRLAVHRPPLPAPVYVDRDMWEKIVLNLLSNAFKFTLEGEIEVRLEAAGRHAVLTVRDTGVGIPADELPHVFERFHRVKGSRGRTDEGTGIGLALVQELAKLHGGTVSAESAPNKGSRFVVTIPLGTAHLDPKRIGSPSDLLPTKTGADAFMQEALGWLPGREPASDADRIAAELNPTPLRSRAIPDKPRAGSNAPRAQVLWADDNTDMREYVARLLGEQFDVVAVADGQAALEAARAAPPDLVLTDIMMPRLDGAGLVRELRADPRLREIPVILLSARAGEEARVGGIAEGADDYLIKPFSARELLARVDAHVRMARLRQKAGEAIRRSEERLRRMVNVAGVGVLLFDESTGTLLDANDAFLRMLGYGREDLTSGALTWRTMTPEEYVSESEQQMEGLAATGRIGPYEKEYLRKDGSRSWMLFAGAALGDGTIVEYCIDVSDRKRAEAALRQAHDDLEGRVAGRTAELAAANERLREEIRERERAEAVRTGLLRRLSTAQEDERRRMSRDLHDQTGQLLAGLSLAIRAVAATGPLPPAAADRLADLQRVADELSRQVHGFALQLRPTALDDIGLEAALGQLVGEWSARTGVMVDFHVAGVGAGRLPPEVETVLYRVVQESLTNVAKYAQAKTVSVVVSRHNGTATAVVEDDGVGFDPEAVERGRLGLIGMRERVTLAGGDLDIESALGVGSTIIARLPVAKGDGGDRYG